jgi:hypothetical protein
MAQLFGDERCTAAILEFLATMEVGLRGRLREDDPGRRGRGRGRSGDGHEARIPGAE